MKAIILICSVLALAAVGHVALSSPSDAGGRRVAEAANAVIRSLDAAQREKACFAFADAERTNWHFVPKIYPGVPLGQLGAKQKRLVHRLLLSVLSSAGYHKTTTIIELEDTLREFAEAAGRKAPHRDPERYSVSFFGKPGGAAPWGFRLQGHHVSWNFTSIDHRIVSTTPAFLGANPAEIREGPHAGLRALPDEEDFARELLATLDATQRKSAILSDRAPADVLFGPGKKRDVLGEPRGVAWKDMSDAQRKIFWRLIETYVHNLRHDVAAAEIAKIDRAGRDGIHFGWMGATDRGEGHYYRIHGPTFAIEYDNTQNRANHVHTVWHDLTNDFGVDLLRDHYEKHHKK